ncbi:MAG: hypothetical protein Q9199_002890, partial [Rusavskia elegans]
MDFEDAGALDRAVATKLGYENRHNVSNVPRKALLSGDVYQVNTANGQPITHAKTGRGTSKGGDGGTSQASGTRSNNGKGYGGRDNTNNQPLNTNPGGGAQGNGRDDDDRNNKNNEKKKRPNSPDANIPDNSSDDENDDHKNLRTKRKTRNKANEPRTPSPKGKGRKTG